MIELNYTNINKAMNISVQSVFHGGERGKKNFTEGNRRLPIFYNNGDTGATSPRPCVPSSMIREQSFVKAEGRTVHVTFYGHRPEDILRPLFSNLNQ